MNCEDRRGRLTCRLARLTGVLVATVALIASMTMGMAQAKVPPKIEAQLQKMGHIVDPGCTAVLYRSMMPKRDIVYQIEQMKKTGKPSWDIPLYKGMTVYRDMSFGPNPKDVVDIFTGNTGPASRPVLIYVPGGVGNKVELQNRAANAFNDNVARWAVQHGMVGVLMQRHGQPRGAKFDYYAGGKDVSMMIQYLEKNIAKYHGNPNRMFAWAQSAGNGPLGIYAGHPKLYGPKGIGLVGIIFMSGQFDILEPNGTNPIPASARRGFGGATSLFNRAGKTCGLKNGAFSTEGVLPGRAPDQPGGQAPFVMPKGGLRFGGPKVPLKVQIERSSLPGLEKTHTRIFLASAQLDPGVNGGMSAFNVALHNQLCKLDGPHAVNGKGHCPMMLFEKGESHMSEVFSVDTPDHTVSGPILAWIKHVEAGLNRMHHKS